MTVMYKQSGPLNYVCLHSDIFTCM